MRNDIKFDLHGKTYWARELNGVPKVDVWVKEAVRYSGRGVAVDYRRGHWRRVRPVFAEASKNFNALVEHARKLAAGGEDTAGFHEFAANVRKSNEGL